MAQSRFALRWRDAEGRSHLGYNYRQTTVGPNGETRVLFSYDAPPTFESTYQDWHTGTAYEPGHHGERPIGELYTLLLRASELGRSALDRFLTEADEAGYAVARWFSGRRDRAGVRAIRQDGDPIQAMTFLLRKRPQSRTQNTTSPNSGSTTCCAH